MKTGYSEGACWAAGGLLNICVRILSLCDAKTEQNTPAWVLSAEISPECDADRTAVRLSHRGRLLFSLNLLFYNQ